MALFNNPGPMVTPKEMERVISLWSAKHGHRIPTDVIEIVQRSVEPYMEEHGMHKNFGLSKEEIPKILPRIKETVKDTHPHWADSVDDLEPLMESAVDKSHFGSTF